jgi:hypothetical protein
LEEVIMKKLTLPLLALSLMFAAPADADNGSSPGSSGSMPAPPVVQQGGDAIPLGTLDDQLCTRAKHQQENRIKDLRSAIEFDKEAERKLLDGADARIRDAATKTQHAKEWREWGSKHPDKANAANAIAAQFETEAATDTRFANERRQASNMINKGWKEAFEAIKGHEKFLGELRGYCGG